MTLRERYYRWRERQLEREFFREEPEEEEPLPPPPEPTARAAQTAPEPTDEAHRPSAVLGYYERALQRIQRLNPLYPEGLWGGMGADTD
jgi:hypothetical protein